MNYVMEEAANISRIPEPDTSGLDMGLFAWEGLQSRLHRTERRYLTSLGLGNPLLAQNFWVTDDGGSRSKSICVLFPKILLLFRVQKDTPDLHFKKPFGPLPPLSPPNSPKVECKKLSVYGVMFPRHMLIIESTLNGSFRKCTLAYRVGFELKGCPGMWLGLNRVSATLRLKFEIVDHGVDVPNRWTAQLQRFKETKYDREYTSIFDRLPLDTVRNQNDIGLHGKGICVRDRYRFGQRCFGISHRRFISHRPETAHFENCRQLVA